MKLTRDDLKSLIKECIVEVLNEGLLGQAGAPIVPRVSGVAESRRQPRPQQQSRPRFDPRLDAPVQQATMMKEAIKRESGGNPIMESIFADTARTTLPSMLSAGDGGTPEPGSGGRAHIAQQEQVNGTPEELFGEDATSRWANLAFMDNKKSA